MRKPDKKYTTATKPNANTVPGGTRIRVQDAGGQETAEYCHTKPDGSREWVVFSRGSAV